MFDRYLVSAGSDTPSPFLPRQPGCVDNGIMFYPAGVVTKDGQLLVDERLGRAT